MAVLFGALVSQNLQITGPGHMLWKFLSDPPEILKMTAVGDPVPDVEGRRADDFSGSRRPLLAIDPVNPATPRTWSMVSIKYKNEKGVEEEEEEEDSASLVFPPINHENLHLSPPPTPSPYLTFRRREEPASFSSLSSFSSSEINDDDGSKDGSSNSTLFSPSSVLDSPPVMKETGRFSAARWRSLWIELLCSKVKGMMLWGARRIPAKASAFATVAMVVGFLYLRWRKMRGRIEPKNGDHILRIIREKDERINQLLNQIALMNETLLALQRLPSPSTH